MMSPVTEPDFADGYMVCFDGSTNTSRPGRAVTDAASLAAAVAFVETLPDDLRRAASRRVLTQARPRAGLPARDPDRPGSGSAVSKCVCPVTCCRCGP